MSRPLLEVVSLHPADAEAAEAGGADRLFLVAGDDAAGHSPEPAVVSSICHATSLPVRVVLRLTDSFTTTGGELSRLVGLGADYLDVGAQGLVFGFLTADLDIDLAVCTAIADATSGAPWTFSRAIDHALDTSRAWRAVATLPGVDAVLTAGSALGVESGLSALTARAQAHPGVAQRMLVGGGLEPEHVPWLLRAGVRGFHVGSQVRPGGSWAKAYVDAGYVRSWRTLLDDAGARLSG
jgi:copper homeostasis protein